MRPGVRGRAGAASLLRAALFTFAAAALGPTLTFAQSPNLEYQVKAVFLYNFAQFTEWPASAFESEDAPFRIGVLGDDPFGDALDEVTRGEMVRDRRVVVEHSHDVQDLADAHLLFIGESERTRIIDILDALRSGPTLTVGDVDGFARLGGGINFYLDGNKVRFEINPDSARSKGIRMSSQLLTLGRIVESGPGVGAE